MCVCLSRAPYWGSGCLFCFSLVSISFQFFFFILVSITLYELYNLAVLSKTREFGPLRNTKIFLQIFTNDISKDSNTFFHLER